MSSDEEIESLYNEPDLLGAGLAVRYVGPYNCAVYKKTRLGSQWNNSFISVFPATKNLLLHRNKTSWKFQADHESFNAEKIGEHAGKIHVVSVKGIKALFKKPPTQLLLAFENTQSERAFLLVAAMLGDQSRNRLSSLSKFLLSNGFLSLCREFEKAGVLTVTEAAELPAAELARICPSAQKAELARLHSLLQACRTEVAQRIGRTAEVDESTKVVWAKRTTLGLLLIEKHLEEYAIPFFEHGFFDTNTVPSRDDLTDKIGVRPEHLQSVKKLFSARVDEAKDSAKARKALDFMERSALYTGEMNKLRAKPQSLNAEVTSSTVPSHFDCFLTHNWGKDELGRVNHETVSKVNNALKANGLVTWFDEDRMEGFILDEMTRGIDNSDVIVVFVTKAYIEKVASSNHSDNCKIEFNYAHTRKSNKMIAVPMEPKMLNPSEWHGPVGASLGGKLYEAHFALDFGQDDLFNAQVNKLYRNIVRLKKKSP